MLMKNLKIVSSGRYETAGREREEGEGEMGRGMEREKEKGERGREIH